MDDTNKMLQAIINGQSAMKSELPTKIDRLDKKVDNLDKKLISNIEGLTQETKKGFEKLTERVDKIGLRVARLEDDTPTREEYDGLERRVGKLEQKIVS